MLSGFLSFHLSAFDEGGCKAFFFEIFEYQYGKVLHFTLIFLFFGYPITIAKENQYENPILLIAGSAIYADVVIHF